VRLGDGMDELVEFVAEGRCRDGELTFVVAPAPGDQDPRLRQATFEALEKEIATALAVAAAASDAERSSAEWDATRLLELKAHAQAARYDDAEAAVTYQRILDAFPTSRRAEWIERQLKILAGVEHENTRSTRERWAKAMSDGCADDMDLRVGSGTMVTERLKRQGLAGLAALAAELEKSCKRTPRNLGGIAAVYRDLAVNAALHDDCADYQAYFAKYVEAGGSVSDMLGWARSSPWCELGDVTKKVMWMTATLDQFHTLEMERNLSAIRSSDGKMLTLTGSKDAPPGDLTLVLGATGPDTFVCRTAQWNRSGGQRMEGKCSVTLTRSAAEKGEYYEGTFSATFEPPEGSGRRTSELTQGRFRLRRE